MGTTVSNSKLKITAVSSSLACGGAEKVLASLTSALVTRNHKLSVVTLASAETDFYSLPPQVKRISLNRSSISISVAHAIKSNLGRVMSLRRAILASSPDVVLAFGDTTNIATLLSMVGTGIPVVAAERSDPRQYRLVAGWESLRRISYPLAAAVVVQTDSLRGWAARVTHTSRVHVIPNPVDATTATSQDIPAILGLGRLVKSKGFDLLLQAFASCADVFPEWNLRIAGDGPEREHLQRLSCDFGIESRVTFVGQIRDTQAFLRTGSVFVLPSRFEGFPNSLLEAMASGLAVLSFDCRSGPREIIRHSKDGLLVPPGDVASLETQLKQLMSNRTLRDKLSTEARTVSGRFGVDAITSKWEDVFERSIGRNLARAA